MHRACRGHATATDLGDKGKDAYFGYGRVNAYGALLKVGSSRLAGSTRYHTSQLVAQYGFASASTAVVVSGEDANFPDALSASGLAGLYNAPIISTAPAALSAEAKAALVKLGVTKVIVVGGTASVSANTVTQIKAIAGVASVDRIAGADRYLTADAVYNYAVGKGKSWINPNGLKRTEYPAGIAWKNSGGKKMAILATGESFPDALAASSLSAYGHYPIFLTNGQTLQGSTKALLANGKFDEIMILGGSTAISESVRTAAKDAVNPKPLAGTTRKWAWECRGTTRYETAYLIASHALREGMPKSRVVLASGETSADALVSSPLKSPILLVHPTNTSYAGKAGTYLLNNQSGINRIVALGGTATISVSVLNYCIKNLWSKTGYVSLAGESAAPRADLLSTG